MQLKTIATRLQIRVQRTAEEMLAMGADLIEAKRVCKEDGKTFESWCDSSECPVGYKTAQQLISVSQELGDKKERALLFDNSFAVLARVTQTRDEDLRAALLEHIEQEAESGAQVTQKEITALKKALREAQEAAKASEEKVFDAQAAIQGYIAERKAADEEAKAAKDARDRVIKELMDKEAERRALEAKIKGHKQELADAQAVYQEQLQDMRERIVKEEANRPRTDAEVAAKEQRLKELRAEEAEHQQRMQAKSFELRQLEEQLDAVRKDNHLWTKMVNDFGTAAVHFHKEASILMVSAAALRGRPVTDALYQQITTLIQEAESVATELRNVITIK